MDVTIIGGGIIGTATAYFLSTRKGISVRVLERDPTYTNASFARSCGGFRHQFVTRENIELGIFGRQFIQKYTDEVQWTDNGYLLLFNEDQADRQRLAVLEQWKHGGSIKPVLQKDLKEMFPWINTEGVYIAGYTETDGWLDPHSLHKVFKQSAIDNGVEFVKTDVCELDPSHRRFSAQTADSDRYRQYCWPDDNSNVIVVTAGCWTKDLLPDIPVAAQKHTVFNIKCPTHIADMPLVGDFTTGIYWRPEGDGYIVGSPTGRFDQDDLEPDHNDFEQLVWEKLALRAPMFESVKVTGAWAGYYDTNTIDNNAIIGKHPKWHNVYLASGFTGRGVMQAPGVGRGLTELIVDGEYKSIDLSCFSPQRLFDDQINYEPYVL